MGSVRIFGALLMLIWLCILCFVPLCLCASVTLCHMVTEGLLPDVTQKYFWFVFIFEWVNTRNTQIKLRKNELI
jgi:hypothetical protein